MMMYLREHDNDEDDHHHHDFKSDDNKNETQICSHENDEDDGENKGGDKEADVEAGEAVAGHVKGADMRTYKSKIICVGACMESPVVKIRNPGQRRRYENLQIKKIKTFSVSEVAGQVKGADHATFCKV